MSELIWVRTFLTCIVAAIGVGIVLGWMHRP